MNDVAALMLAIINTCTHYAELELSKCSNVRILSLDKYFVRCIYLTYTVTASRASQKLFYTSVQRSNFKNFSVGY